MSKKIKNSDGRINRKTQAEGDISSLQYKIKAGKKEYDTPFTPAKKSWKNYRLKQNKKIKYFDDSEVDAIMLNILDEYAPAFKALANK